MCKRTGILAVRDNFGHVVECGCGTIHMTIGPVTVSLDSKSLRTLHEMLGTAIENENMSIGILEEAEPLLHSTHFAIKKVVKLKH
jgi:hypothetical protein